MRPTVILLAERDDSTCVGVSCRDHPIACTDCGIYQLCLPPDGGEADNAILDQITKNRRVFKRGDYIFRLGRPFHAIYAIRSGSVKTYVWMDDGRVQVTGFHIAGELLGLNAINSKRYHCEAQVLETTSVCEIPFNQLEALVRGNSSIQYQILRIMSREMLQNQELILLLGKKNAEERLATYLIWLSRRLERRHLSPCEFNLSMSRGDIGNHLGIAEETVCRVLSRFEDEGLIELRRRYIRLKAPERLAQIGSVAEQVINAGQVG